MIEMQYYERRNGYLLRNYGDLNLISGGARVSQMGSGPTLKRGGLTTGADPGFGQGGGPRC